MQQQWWRKLTAANQLKWAAEIYRKYHTIQAIPREVSGPRISARDRAQGRIPAVVFSSSAADSEKQLITTERKQIHSILKAVGPNFFCSTTFKLQVRAGSGSSLLLHSKNVLPIKLHRDEETGKVLNMVFVCAEEGSKLEVDVPVVFNGLDACPGLKKGGQLNTIRKTLKYLCPTECIPQRLRWM
ncbi:50S ribosomal protein L25 [Bienertia sinuspersici]